MVEDGGMQDETKLDFDSAGEAVAYISLDQARVLALQHARDNRDVYGRYSEAGLVWDVIGAEETEDYYEVRLSYLPAGNFREAGVEQFTQALRLNPVRADLYVSRATAYDGLGEEQKANSDRAIACQVDQTFCGAAQPLAP